MLSANRKEATKNMFEKKMHFMILDKGRLYNQDGQFVAPTDTDHKDQKTTLAVSGNLDVILKAEYMSYCQVYSASFPNVKDTVELDADTVETFITKSFRGALQF